jgi:hypothetical protein
MGLCSPATVVGVVKTCCGYPGDMARLWWSVYDAIPTRRCGMYYVVLRCVFPVDGNVSVTAKMGPLEGFDVMVCGQKGSAYDDH